MIVIQKRMSDKDILFCYFRPYLFIETENMPGKS